MTTHEKLKLICDTIWYDIHWYWFDKNILEWTILVKIIKNPVDKDVLIILNERIIIFTPGFIEKFEDRISNKIAYQDFRRELMFHLDNPVEYLYNILDLWKQ